MIEIAKAALYAIAALHTDLDDLIGKGCDGGQHHDDALEVIANAIRAALDEAAKVARDCAIYDTNDRLLNSDIRATCAQAIRDLARTPSEAKDEA